VRRALQTKIAFIDVCFRFPDEIRLKTGSSLFDQRKIVGNAKFLTGQEKGDRAGGV
jgi:hypothetical protein